MNKSALKVSIEIQGQQVHVGGIERDDSYGGYFSYAKEYMESENARPISINLPLREEPFNKETTKIFFDGLLPEGFSRRSVALWLGVAEEDYLSILAGLGSECIGAVRICEEDIEPEPPNYKKISKAKIKDLAQEGAEETAQLTVEAHLSLAGASGKVGLYREDKRDEWYLPIGDAPSTHIVKQSHIRYSNLVVNEKLVLLTASKLGIDVPENLIINLGEGEDSEVLFATRRYDRTEMSERKVGNHLCPYRRHQEDFAQALGIESSSKYEREGENYLRLMSEIIRRYTQNPAEDLRKLWDLVVFNWLIGNTDNHIKNHSLLYSPDLERVSLAPAYDLVSTVVYTGSTRRLAFNIGGVYLLDNVDDDAWRHAAKDIGLGERYGLERVKDMSERVSKALNTSAAELVEQGFPKAKEIAKSIKAKAGIGIKR